MSKGKFKRLGDALAEIEKVDKSSSNPHFKSKYADINALLAVAKPALQKYGFMLVQPTVIDDGQVIQMTKVIDAESGDVVLQSEMVMDLVDNPQKNFSMSTYYRRLTLQNLLSMQAEDDDGNSVSIISQSKPSTSPNRRRF